jgi:predicted nuclease with RNAse H fold
MRYCGVVPVGEFLQLAMLEEIRQTEPPIRLGGVFYEPGTADQIASELTALGDVVVAIGAPISDGERACDEALRTRGLVPARAHPEALGLAEALAPMGIFEPAKDELEGPVPDGAYREGPVFETNADAVFCTLQGRRPPAKRHPQGIRVRISALENQVLDDGGELWQRRIEEIDAGAAALCAHRYAVGYASWLGNPAEPVLVLPGASIPEAFTTRGVLAAVERLHLPQID